MKKKTNPTPPEGCTCASFWTVRQKHKLTCALSPAFKDKVDEILDKGVLNHWTRSQIKAALDQAYQEKHAEEIRQLQVKHAAEMSILDQEITSLKAAIKKEG